MIKLTYNPFGKEIDNITAIDLDVLRQVAEGWYIEYKSTTVPAKNIAKSLAAFANHYGGWIFYGVEGARDGSNLAAAFPGLDKKETATMIENIKNAAKDSVNPSPYYEYAVINGPCQEIDLLDDRSIIIVVVPSGVNTPYIHNDGRIYRRIADSSDPKSENDRFILDQLWERKKKSEKILSSFLKQKPVISKAEEDKTFMHIFLLQDPMNPAREDSNLTFDQFADIMSNSGQNEEGISIPFDNFFVMSRGFVARHVFHNDPYNLVLTWKHYADGSSVISCPLRKYSGSLQRVSKQLQGYQYSKQFIQQLQKQKHNMINIIDIHLILLMIASFISKHTKLIENGKLPEHLYAKAAFENIWRTTPFIDTHNYIQFSEKCGLPIVQDCDQFAPPGTNFDSLTKIDIEDGKNDIPIVNQIVRSVIFMSQVANTLGIPSRLLFSEGDQWIEAIIRSTNILNISENDLLDDFD